MNTYLVEGLAPLVFRSGKPFGAHAGADGAAFPLPSSVAGLTRTLQADQTGLDFPTHADKLRQLSCRGPLLARRQVNGIITPLVPKPADALYLQDGAKIRVIRLSPAPLGDDCGCDLPVGLLPVQMREALDGKPAPGPQFWPLTSLVAWQAGESVCVSELQTDGLMSFAAEQRTHVALDDVSLAADDGRLFQTGGIDLGAQRKQGGWQDSDHVLLVRSEATLSPTLATFGGERRLSRLDTVHDNVWPVAPNKLTEAIRSAGGLQLTLTTPGIFSAGYLPGWLDGQTLEGSPPGCEGLRLKLRAVAIERWLPVSGWDLLRQRPKAMRKAVAAGAVYWFSLVGEVKTDAATALWLTALSDHEQDRRDGFGLGLPAAWTPA